MIEKFLNNRFFILYLIPLLLGLLSTLSFQPINFTLINFFILPLFFYLIVYIKRKSKSTYRKKPFKKIYLFLVQVFGFGFYLSGIHWITNSLTFDESFRILIPIGLILIPLFLSLFFSIFTLIVGSLLSLNFYSIFFFSAFLGLSDYLRAKILTGFPWNIWAYSFSSNVEIIQILNELGLFAFNLVIITLFVSPVVVFFNLKLSKKILFISLIPLVLLSFYIYGSFSINTNKLFLNTFKNSIKIKVISPSFKLEYGLSDKAIRKRVTQLIKYSEPENDSSTLYIWPEGVFSGYNFKEILFLKKNFLDNFSENDFILFGVNRFDENRMGFYNSLIIVNNHLEIVQEYKKQKLVPFGEFLPLEKILNKFGLKKITEGYGSFLKGEQQDNLKIEKLNILPLICYEIIFTELAQKSHADTNLIVNISEDAWFGNSIGPYQHFAKAVFRAIEQNTFLVRSANKGISAIIDNKGQIIKKLNLSEAGNIELEVPLIKTEKKEIKMI